VVTRLLSGFLTVVGVWTAAFVLLAWAEFPGRWRRALALVTSVAGLVFLVLALSTEGFRETQSMAVLLVGTPFVTSLSSASASLPYYVLTGLCLLLGTLGLAISDSVAALAARRFLAWAIAASLLVLLVRFALEKVAAPGAWTRLFGVTWLAPVVGAYFWLRLREEGRGLAALVGRLVLYGLAVRGAVALLYVAATALRLGSHFDLSSVVVVKAPWGAVYHFTPGGFPQLLNLAIFPQVVIWPVFTVVSGLLGAALTALLVWAWQRRAV
jgi:hypothetical protein